MRDTIEETPRTITPQIIEFAQELGADDLQYLKPDEAQFGGRAGNCFNNVLEFIEERQKRYKQPLAVTLGYMFFEVPNFILSAELHAVVATPLGPLCVTKQPKAYKRILFGEKITCYGDLPDSWIESNLVQHRPMCEKAEEYARLMQESTKYAQHGLTLPARRLICEANAILDALPA